MEKGGGKEGGDDEMENRIREVDRGERPEDRQARRQSGASSSLAPLHPNFSLPPAVFREPVGSALCRQVGMLKRERKGADQESKVLMLEIKFLPA